MPQLAVRTRSGRVESVHDGYICVTDSDKKLVHSIGSPDAAIFMRSAGKPLIAVTFVRSGALEKFDISLKELAVMCSSHEGQAFHRRAILSILKKIGLSEKELECGRKYPESEQVHDALVKLGKRPTPIFSNCSGKHAGMLALCRVYDFPIKGYTDPGHPLQQLVKRTMAELLECDEKDVITGTDGCTLPTYLLTLRQASWLYARLGDGYEDAGFGKCFGLIKKAMMTYPRYIHGDDTFGTDLAVCSGGKVIGKLGAEGGFCMAIPGKRLGVCLKLSDGHPWASFPVAVSVLEQLGILDGNEVKRLSKWSMPEVVDDKGNTVGYIHPTFNILENHTSEYRPGDIYPAADGTGINKERRGPGPPQ